MEREDPSFSGVPVETTVGPNATTLRSGPSDPATPVANVPHAGVLQIGDVIVSVSGWSQDTFRFFKVERVTATHAITAEYRFRRQMKKNWYYKEQWDAIMVGSDKHGRCYYVLATAQHYIDADLAARKRAALNVVHSVEWKSLDILRLEKICEVLRVSDPEGAKRSAEGDRGEQPSP